MKKNTYVYGFVTFLLSAFLIVGCSSLPVPKERLEKVAVITEGSTNTWLAVKFLPKISVAEVDGKAVENIYGPIELEPGKHSVKMKCGNSTNIETVTARAGEVYEFGYGPGNPVCYGRLVKVRQANK